MKKGSISGVSMVLAADMLFNYCFSYKEPKLESVQEPDKDLAGRVHSVNSLPVPFFEALNFWWMFLFYTLTEN